jgi:hypothetical protein
LIIRDLIEFGGIGVDVISRGANIDIAGSRRFVSIEEYERVFR